VLDDEGALHLARGTHGLHTGPSVVDNIISSRHCLRLEGAGIGDNV
jgi:hypothetical protein